MEGNMSVGIYKIENLINGKCYIGQSINIELRWKRHKEVVKNCDYPLYLAIRKYGIENFSFDIVQECEPSKLDELEIYWIKYYNSYYDGYNQTRGGDQYSWNVKISDEDLLEIVELLKNSHLSQTEIAKKFNVGNDTISEINNGKTRVLDNIEYPIRKNKKDKCFCESCGKAICSHSRLCVQCASIAHRKVDRPSKEELFNLLCQYNGHFTNIAKLYNVTDNAIRRWCRDYDLPSHTSDYLQRTS
jgi:group I intron endonuclease